MPPKNIKSGQQPRIHSQTGSGNGEQASKLTVSEQRDANGSDSTNSILLAIQSLRDDMTRQSPDTLEAINGFKTELMSHSKRIGEAEDRISQTEEDVNTLWQKAKNLDGGGIN